MKKFFCFFSFFSLALVSSIFASNIESFSIWPDTGLTVCYDDEKEIVCPGKGSVYYGQDAHYIGTPKSYTKLGYNGIELPDSATQADGWIMTRDNVTGLIWEIKTDDGSIHDKDNTYTWCNTDSNTNGGNPGACSNGTDTEDFINQLNQSNFGGFNDWRLPTQKEILSITDYSTILPAMNTDYFPSIELNPRDSNIYWLSAGIPNRNLAWASYASMGGIGIEDKGNSYRVRAVRGGIVSVQTVSDNYDGIVKDDRTELEWMKCPYGQTYDLSADSCNGTALELKWEEALAACENLTAYGFDDWRLPNVNELVSILDYSVNYGVLVIGTNYFELGSTWTSTSDSSFELADLAWTVNTFSGEVDYRDDKNTKNYALCVRGGNVKEKIFRDIPSDYWSFHYIKYLADSGITSGCGKGNFCPSDLVTRAQMAVFLIRGIHGSNFTPPSLAFDPFNDVPFDHWAGSWIKQLADDGITSGCGNYNYCPNDPVTRAQMAVFLLRAKYGSNHTPTELLAAPFNDVPMNHWAAAWISELADEGITSGCGSGNYCPDAPVTRAQMAVFLVRLFELDTPSIF